MRRNSKQLLDEIKTRHLVCSCGGLVMMDSYGKKWRVKCMKCDRHTEWKTDRSEARQAWDAGDIYIMGIKD